jgi:hypothetical protein
MQFKFLNSTLLTFFLNAFINFSHVRIVGSIGSCHACPFSLDIPLTDLCQELIIVLFIYSYSRDFLDVTLAWFILNRFIKIHALIPPKDVTPQK